MSLKYSIRWSRYSLATVRPKRPADLPSSQIRRLHVSTPALKNPYYFYDLQKMQGPSANAQSEDPSFVPGRRTFDPLANQPTESMQERVKKVFGALGSRDESRKEAQLKGITVAGITVPARPEEPTNCCMSGCVNCVWELYKDELEEYKEIRTKARHRLAASKYDYVKWPSQLGPEPSERKARIAADSNVGDSNVQKERPAEKTTAETHKLLDEEDDDGMDEGIRVFIETEKKLHEKRLQLKQKQTQENVL